MIREVFLFEFFGGARVAEIRRALAESLRLSVRADGPERVQRNLRCVFDPKERIVLVDAGTSVGSDFRMYFSSCAESFVGKRRFRKRRIEGAGLAAGPNRDRDPARFSFSVHP